MANTKEYLYQIFNLEGKLAVITGGNKGIGKYLSIGLANAGANIIILSRSSADDVVSEIEQLGRKAYHIKTDVSSSEEITKAFEEISSRFPSLDIVINNAGITSHHGLFEAEVDEFRKLLETNLIGEYVVAREAAKIMVDKKTHGSIVNVSSISAHIVNSPNMQIAYNVSKAAVSHMTRNLALELVPYNIRVNTLSPGYMGTPMSEDVDPKLKEAWFQRIPMGRLGKCEELLPAVLYLVSSMAGYTTGSEIIVDGGYLLL